MAFLVILITFEPILDVFFFWGFGKIQKSKMADQDGRHSEMITELLRHVTSSRHVADAKSRCHYFYIREIKTRVYPPRSWKTKKADLNRVS